MGLGWVTGWVGLQVPLPWSRGHLVLGQMGLGQANHGAH